MKNTSPSLSLREMWKLHLLLPNVGENIFENLMEMPPEVLVKSLRVLYKRKVPQDNMVGKFLSGLKKEEFFSFKEFVKVLSASN